MAGAAPSGAPVVVTVVIDQLAAWVARERFPLLPDGGFRRLVREGTWVKDLTYLHAVTETAPGHAALYTGKTPHENGIVGNAVWRKDLGKATSLLEDGRTKLLGPNGDTKRPGVSLANLRVPTLADALLAKDPGAAVVSLSLKDRGVAFGGGRRPTAAIWYDEQAGSLATSSAFSENGLPGWVKRFERPVREDSQLRWDLSDADFAKHARTNDDQLGETADIGGRIFPHQLAPGLAAAAAFRATPMADGLIADLGLAAVDALRKPDHPLLLALSFSANDYVGHNFGPDSWEAWDELRQLDATIGRLLSGLDSRLGKDGYSVILSGDHGIAPLPESLASTGSPAKKPGWCATSGLNPYEKPCQAHARIVAGDLKKALESAVGSVFKKPAAPMIRDVVEALVFLTDDARALPPAQKKQLDQTIRLTLARQPEVAHVFSLSEFPGACPPATDEKLAALVCRATTPDIGDYYVVPKAGSFFWSKASEGTSHGTPYRYDRTVPLLVRYPHGAGGLEIERAPFGSFYASAWYALTGETSAGEYGSVVGAK